VRFELHGAGNQGFRFGLADSQSGSAGYEIRVGDNAALTCQARRVPAFVPKE
jgi:hypothetical protein